MFAIVFGLGMDYESFPLSRVREARPPTGVAQAAVAHALEVTGRVVTCAAPRQVGLVGPRWLDCVLPYLGTEGESATAAGGGSWGAGAIYARTQDTWSVCSCYAYDRSLPTGRREHDR
ncbi:MMPL family transporter [Streptomyces sp. NPDC048258]|uniref:MMPL family transporter n=1 Tax=Streptomyces sp. NPDC048258 TaxID=3365527 RepID=UPI003720D52F